MVTPAVDGIDLFKIAGRSISGWIPSLKTDTVISAVSVTLTCGSVGLPMREEPPLSAARAYRGAPARSSRPRSSTSGIRPVPLTTAGQRAW
jgi:hypothetical protein